MKEQLKVFKIIHIALVAGLIIAYIILGHLTDLSQFKLPSITNDNMVYLLIPIAAFLISNFMFKTLVSKIDPTLSLKEKLPVYLSASIAHWAILEGAAFLILILEPDFLIFGILLIVYLAFLRPTENKIKTDLNILNN